MDTYVSSVVFVVEKGVSAFAAFTETSFPSQPQPPPAMKLNIAYPSTGNQKFIEIDDEKKL